MPLFRRNITIDYIYAGNSRLYKGPKMSEEERKEKPKCTRKLQGRGMKPFTAFALAGAIASFLGAFLCVPIILWTDLYGHIWYEQEDIVWYSSYLALHLIGTLSELCYAISLVLSLVAYFLEPKKFYRLLPFAFLVAGACLIRFGYFLTDWL